MQAIYFVRIGIILVLLVFFNIFFHFIYKKMKKRHEKENGKNSKYYRGNIYIFSISLTLISLIIIPISIYGSYSRNERPTPTLYTSFFILMALILSHIAQLIKILDEK